MAVSQADERASVEVGEFFRTEPLVSDLRGQSVRGGAASLAAQAARMAIQVGAMAVLARLLRPEDFGLIAMVTAVTGFLGMFADPGLSLATVQQRELNHGLVSTLFWINGLVGLCLTTVAALAAPLLAWLYGDSRLTSIGMLLAASFLPQSFSLQHQALLRRRMSFATLSAIDVGAFLGGSLAGIYVAHLGVGYWALVVVALVYAMLNMVLTWGLCPWRPSLPAWDAAAWPLMRFGGHVTAFNGLNYVARNADNVLIGWWWGPSALGFYSKAYQLLLVPLAQISGPLANVAIAGLSSLQASPERYRRYYTRALTLVAYGTFPIIAILFALCDDLVLIVLGNQWTGVGRIFRVLALAAVFQPVLHSTAWIYLSLGRTRRLLTWGFLSVPIILGAFLAGVRWGPLGVAVSYAICIAGLTWPCVAMAVRDTSIEIGDVLRAVWRPLVAGVVLLAATMGVRHFVPPAGPVIVAAISAAAGLVAAAACLALWPSFRTSFSETVAVLPDLLKRGGATAQTASNAVQPESTR